VENSCQKEKQYCEKTYGCQEVCPNDEKRCKKDEKVWECNCPEPTPEVTPEVTPVPVVQESAPQGPGPSGPPACTDSKPKEVANPHVYRKGDCAIVKWYPTEGDKANIYYKQNSSEGWQYSVVGVPNTGYREICGLGKMDITFGVQSVNGCAADGIVNASNLSTVVDGSGNHWTLFR
jgi:hypothetical protein